MELWYKVISVLLCTFIPEMPHRHEGQLNKWEGNDAVNMGRCPSLWRSSDPASPCLWNRAAGGLVGVGRWKEKSKPNLKTPPPMEPQEATSTVARRILQGEAVGLEAVMPLQTRQPVQTWFSAFNEPAAEQFPAAWPAVQNSNWKREMEPPVLGPQGLRSIPSSASQCWGKQAVVPSRTGRE